MDAFLETPHVFADLRAALAVRLSEALNLSLPEGYYACICTRREIPSDGLNEFPTHKFVEIRNPTRGHKLITLIEIVSPTNKRRGPERALYERKFEETFASDASIIELDLLRGGERILHGPALMTRISLLKPAPDYLLLVNRAWQRAPNLIFQTFPLGLRDSLPCIPVPLRQGENEVPLDLQFIFQRVYEEGPYQRGLVDYAKAPEPALRHEDVIWAHERLEAGGLVTH